MAGASRAGPDTASEGCKLCRAFTQSITIMADGTVTPCPFVALPIGNIRRTPLDTLLRESYRDAALGADDPSSGPRRAAEAVCW
jgi:radical SAM protein with 4Fe4S-binding SPASM domain